MQNLSALADYNQETETSAGDTVGGVLPRCVLEEVRPISAVTDWDSLSTLA